MSASTASRETVTPDQSAINSEYDRPPHFSSYTTMGTAHLATESAASG